jgi:polysaccharide export outer membrane protein
MHNRHFQPTRIAILALVIGAVAFACAHRAVEVAPSDPAPGTRPEAYVIGVRDVLRISVWQNQAVTVDVPVRPDGMVSIPLIQDIKAEGLTPNQLKDVITKQLSRSLKAPEVTVIVLEINSRSVSVVGRVMKTARLPMSEDMRVVEAIALAGGFDAYADRSSIRVVRHKPDGSEVEYHFNYDAYMAGHAPGTNLLLQPGDVVYVPD